MTPFSALFGAASRLAATARGARLAPSVDVSAGAEGVAAETTVLIGGEDPKIGADPVFAAWFARLVGAVSGDLDLSRPGRLGGQAVWPILTEGGGDFAAGALAEAIPRGAAWVVALRPERFFHQAADRLEARGDERGADWAARLRSPTGNLALVGRLVRVVAIALEVGSPAVLRMRLSCNDEAAAIQATIALQAWRVRRSLGEGAGAQAFASATLVREGTRVEMSLPGEVDTLTTLFGRR